MSIAIWPWVANACLHCPKETQEWNSNTALVAEEERMEGIGQCKGKVGGDAKNGEGEA